MESAHLLAALGIAIAGASCGDPVHDGQVDALGPEAPGVSPGPTHRPGQPCLVCHGGMGPAGTEFAFGGTVFQIPGATTGYAGATVRITNASARDAGAGAGGFVTAVTNSAGNFYVLASDYTAAFPVYVELDQGTYHNPMFTHIQREGSCGICHYDPPGPGTPGHVYMAFTLADLPDGGTP